MAEASVFDRGLQQGYARGEEPHLRSQAREDQEFQLKISDLVDQRKTLQQRLPTLTGADGKATPEYDKAMNDLQENAKAIREMYHPDKNPGAIAKFGHYLTDAIHSRTPQERVQRRDQRVGEKILKNEAVDKDAANRIALSAPPTVEQEAANESRARQAKLEEAVKNWKSVNKDATPEEERDFRQRISESAILGMKPSASEDRGNWELVTGKKDGKPFSYYHDKVHNKNTTATGMELAPSELENFERDEKPVKLPKKTANDILIESYIASLHSDAKTFEDLSPEQQANFPKWKNALAQRSSTRQSTVADRDGNVHVIDLTSTSGPIEVFHSGSDQNHPQSGGGNAPKSDTPKNGSSHFKDGPQLKHDIMLNFKKSTPDYNDAKKKYNDSERIALLADKWVQHPSSEADANFVLELIRSEAGRVNQNEINQMFQAGGIEEMPERWAAKAGHGELAPALRSQLVSFIHDTRDVAKQVLQEMDTPQNGGGQQPNPGGRPPKATHKINWPKGTPDWYWADKDGNNLGKITNASPN